MAIKFTDEQMDLKALAKEFFEKEVRPVMAEIDARPNAKDCFPSELIRKASHVGGGIRSPRTSLRGDGRLYVSGCLQKE